jgi:hypothetical protein
MTKLVTNKLNNKILSCLTGAVVAVYAVKESHESLTGLKDLLSLLAILYIFGTIEVLYTFFTILFCIYDYGRYCDNFVFNCGFFVQLGTHKIYKTMNPNQLMHC